MCLRISAGVKKSPDAGSQLFIEPPPAESTAPGSNSQIPGGGSADRDQEYFPGVLLSILPSNFWAVHPFFL